MTMTEKLSLCEHRLGADRRRRWAEGRQDYVQLGHTQPPMLFFFLFPLPKPQIRAHASSRALQHLAV